MMRAFVFTPGVGLLFLCGCAGTTSFQSAPATAVRTSILEKIPSILERSLRGAGWQPEITATDKTGNIALNSKETWDETATTITFTVRVDDAEPKLLSTNQSAAVLTKLKSFLTSAIENAGGEVLETIDGEAYREKLLSMTYKYEKVVGTIKITLSPVTDQPEETQNRFQLVVREQTP